MQLPAVLGFTALVISTLFLGPPLPGPPAPAAAPLALHCECDCGSAEPSGQLPAWLGWPPGGLWVVAVFLALCVAFTLGACCGAALVASCSALAARARPRYDFAADRLAGYRQIGA